MEEPVAEQTPARVRLHFAPEGGEVRVPAGTTVFDGASLERHRDRLHLRRPRHLQEVQGAGHRRQRPDRRASTAARSRPTSCATAGGWPAARSPTRTSRSTVPPLQTRPKAALVGVGRHVILRPAVIKRYLELSEPDMEDQLSDLERVRAAIDDFDLRVELDVVRTLGKTLRDANWKVTAVIVDDKLIDVEPGDTTERRHAIAFDLGTTTVVATLLDLSSGAAARGALDPQQAAALRRRRDLAHLGHDDGRHGARHPAAPGARDARPAGPGGLRGGRRAARRGLRDHARRQPDDDAAGARASIPSRCRWRRSSSPRARCPRPRRSTSASRCTSGRRPRSSRRWAPTWAATSSPACSRPA